MILTNDFNNKLIYKQKNSSKNENIPNKTTLYAQKVVELAGPYYMYINYRNFNKFKGYVNLVSHFYFS